MNSTTNGSVRSVSPRRHPSLRVIDRVIDGCVSLSTVATRRIRPRGFRTTARRAIRQPPTRPPDPPFLADPIVDRLRFFRDDHERRSASIISLRAAAAAAADARAAVGGDVAGADGSSKSRPSNPRRAPAKRRSSRRASSSSSARARRRSTRASSPPFRAPPIDAPPRPIRGETRPRRTPTTSRIRLGVRFWSSPRPREARRGERRRAHRREFEERKRGNERRGDGEEDAVEDVSRRAPREVPGAARDVEPHGVFAPRERGPPPPPSRRRTPPGRVRA